MKDVEKVAVESVIAEKILKRVQMLVEAETEKYPEADYDKTHTFSVRDYGLDLARERNLDPKLSEIILLLHDAGRLLRLEGGPHSETGAAFAARFLNDLSINHLMTVCSAIHKHSSKGRIGSAYEELVKDSDTLAHRDVFEDGIKPAEIIRLQVLEAGPFKMAYSGKPPMELYNQLVAEIMHSGTVLCSEDVHMLRVRIRTLRSLLELCAEKGALDKRLEAVFRLLELPRKLDVFEDMLVAVGVENKKISVLKDAAYRKLARKLPKMLSDLAELSNHEELVFSPSNHIRDYFACLGNVDFENGMKLHALRVAGKKVKYMVEAGMLECSPSDYKAINTLHKAIGAYHDVSENAEIMKMCNMQVKGAIKRHFKAVEKSNLKKIRHAVFYLQLRLRTW